VIARLAADAVRAAGRQEELRQQCAAKAAVMRSELAVRQEAAVRQRHEVDGGQLFGYCVSFIERYARMPRSAVVASVAWAFHTWARDPAGMLVWEATPKLMFLSSRPGSGKSRALELTCMLCPDFYGLDTEPSMAALTWSLGKEHATIGLDEADILVGSGKRHEAVRAVLNASAYRSGTVLRMRGGRGERCAVFGPIAMAGLDVMTNGSSSAALAPLFDRSIIVRMRKSAESVPQLDGQARRVAELLRTALAAWSVTVRDQLAAARPAIPGFLANRSEQMWTPLLACADSVGWGEEIRHAAEDLVQYADSGDEDQDVMGDLAGMIRSWED
jgi:Protein of unknown function (DUF3631)